MSQRVRGQRPRLLPPQPGGLTGLLPDRKGVPMPDIAKDIQGSQDGKGIAGEAPCAKGMNVIQRYDDLKEDKKFERNTATGITVNGVSLIYKRRRIHYDVIHLKIRRRNLFTGEKKKRC